LRWAIPGGVLVAASAFLWGRGWWVYVLSLVGLAMIIWPMPARRPR